MNQQTKITIPFVLCLPQYQNLETKLLITGSIDQLGNWEAEKGVQLEMIQSGIWRAQIEIMNDQKSFQWKYVEIKDQLIWQEMQNNQVSVEFIKTMCANNGYDGTYVKLMTFNIRYLNYSDGINLWEYRRDSAIATIVDSKADFIGLQEVVSQQAKDIMKVVGERYNYRGRIRNLNDNNSEASPILYDKSKWTCMKDKTIWLSSSPNVENSQCFNSSLPRIATIGVFINNYNKDIIMVINTHFDLNQEARKQSVPVLLKFIEENIKEFNCSNAFLLGDFNSDRDSPIIQAILSFQNLKFIQLSPKKINTFHGFQGEFGINNEEIDHIFCIGKNYKLESYDRIQQEGFILNGGRVFPSDHYPVQCVMIKI